MPKGKVKTKEGSQTNMSNTEEISKTHISNPEEFELYSTCDPALIPDNVGINATESPIIFSSPVTHTSVKLRRGERWQGEKATAFLDTKPNGIRGFVRANSLAKEYLEYLEGIRRERNSGQIDDWVKQAHKNIDRSVPEPLSYSRR